MPLRVEAGRYSERRWLVGWRAACATLRQLRLYETMQLMVPALAGIVLSSRHSVPAPSAIVAMFAAMFAHLLFTYTYNDYVDFDRDLRNTRKASSGVGRDRRTLGGLSLALFIVFWPLLLALPPAVGALLAASQALGLLYSWPPVYLKARPPASLAAHLVTGVAYFLAGAWLGGVTFGFVPLWGALCFGLVYASGGVATETVDRQADAGAGVRTLAVRLGSRRSGTLAMALQLAALGALGLLAEGTWPRAIVLAALLGYIAAAGGVSRRQCLPQPLYRLIFGIAVGTVLVPPLWGWIAG